MRFKIKVGDFEVEQDLKETLEIDASSPEALANQLTKIPSVFYYFVSLGEQVAKIKEKYTFEFEKWYAEKYENEKRNLIEELGKTMVNESLVKYTIITNYTKEYEKWKKTLVYLEEKQNTLNSIKVAILRKHEALINLLAYYKRMVEGRTSE